MSSRSRARTRADARLGSRLRQVRRQQGRSLQDVETASGGRIKASAMGAYERGERALTLERLRELADFFDVPVGELLPEPARREPSEPRGAGAASPGVVIDLVALESRRGELPVLARYVEGLRERRGDRGGRVLTVRADDLVTIAAASGTTPHGLREQLEAARVVR